MDVHITHIPIECRHKDVDIIMEFKELHRGIELYKDRKSGENEKEIHTDRQMKRLFGFCKFKFHFLYLPRCYTFTRRPLMIRLEVYY